MGGMEWTDLTHHTNRWQALANVVMNLGVPYNAGNFLTVEDLLASQDGLCSMKLVIFLVHKIFMFYM